MTVTTTFSRAEVYDCMKLLECNYDDALNYLAGLERSNAPKLKMDYSVFKREPEIIWLGYLLWDYVKGA